MSEYDCQTCGACCAHFCDEDLTDIGRRGRGVYIGNDDVAGIPRKLIVIAPCGPSQDEWLRGKRVNGRWQCAALEGIIGERCACSIYDVRPATCRVFEPGSEKCIEARRAVLGES